MLPAVSATVTVDQAIPESVASIITHPVVPPLPWLFWGLVPPPGNAVVALAPPIDRLNNALSPGGGVPTTESFNRIMGLMKVVTEEVLSAVLVSVPPVGVVVTVAVLTTPADGLVSVLAVTE